MSSDGLDGFVKDTRSTLAKALGDKGTPVHILDLYDGTGARLDGVPLALRAVPESVRVKAVADALRFLTGPKCGMSEEYLYGTGDGAAELALETGRARKERAEMSLSEAEELAAHVRAAWTAGEPPPVAVELAAP